MRRLSVLLLLVLPIFAAAAPFEARSPRHLLTIQPVALKDGSVHYDMKITDLVTGKVLGTPKMMGLGGMLAHEPIDVDGLHIVVQLGDAGGDLTVNVTFEKGDEVVDEIRATWLLKQRRVHLHASTALRVGGDVKAPVVVERVEPVYPDEARKAYISGTVIIEMIVDRTGHVADAVVLKPLPMGLSDCALDAVKQWVFTPGTLNGMPVDVIFLQAVNFKLDSTPPVVNSPQRQKEH
jgi:TonB family protein